MKVRVLIVMDASGRWVVPHQTRYTTDKELFDAVHRQKMGASQMWYLETDIPCATIPVIRCDVPDTFPEPVGQKVLMDRRDG